ncbi:hypothetical protein FJN11_10485 [Streptococcus symci]|uniref:Uncharacterized protein n=2 Tax=Streptococcus TaxID=1301 RepID=A0A501P7U5_9STRE|nr:hypothetical protein [Streptococcus mitis]TPD56142.1 hypothetical protein FJN11_10485 [Streptococcus symci]
MKAWQNNASSNTTFIQRKLITVKLILNENQTRKLAAGRSKHCFEVVDKTDEVSSKYYFEVADGS